MLVERAEARGDGAGVEAEREGAEEEGDHAGEVGRGSGQRVR